MVLEKNIFKGFYYIWAWQPFWSMDHDHFSNLSFSCPKEAPHKIWATLAQRLQRRSHLKLSTVFPYKCMGPMQTYTEATWPRRKKVKWQCTAIILAILVDLPSPMICAKIQPEGILCSGEEDFYHIWAWRPSWSMDANYFSNLSFPCPREVPNKIWATLAQRLHRRSHFEILNIFPIQMHREANLTSSWKGQMSMYDHYFSNFGRPPVPDALCKDSAIRHPRFWRRRFLKVFTIYGHGDHLGQLTVTILAILHSPNLRRLDMKFEQKWLRGFRGEVVWKC